MKELIRQKLLWQTGIAEAIVAARMYQPDSKEYIPVKPISLSSVLFKAFTFFLSNMTFSFCLEFLC
jgi:hypothetical protein